VIVAVTGGTGFVGAGVVRAHVERGDDAQSVPQDQAPPAWYYCPESKAYYPYVKECPGGWQQVAPQPPPGH